MRPPLNSGTLARLQRLGSFLLFSRSQIRSTTSSVMVELDEIEFTGGVGVGGCFGLARAAHRPSCRRGSALRLRATGLERETAEFRLARVQGETGRAAAERVSLARGEIPRARPGYWLWRCCALGVPRLRVRQCEQAWPSEFGWTSVRAGLRSRRCESNAEARWFFPSTFAMGAVLTAAAKPDSNSERARDSQLAASSTCWPTSC
jgi:hypothetical protein